MAGKPLILDFAAYDLNNVIADIHEIRKYNRQRYEMEHLTAICYMDEVNHVCVGYKDLGPDEFWVRGHMPGMPLMPGVIMCEAAAQLCSFLAGRQKLLDGMLGFGGLEDVRFRGVVKPGDRFVIVAKLLKIRRFMLVSEFQCFVNQEVVCEGIIKGVLIPTEAIVGSLPAAE